MVTPPDAVAAEIRKAVLRDNIALEEILPLTTVNAAKRLGIADRKGSLEAGKDADIVLLDKDLKVDTVYARGKLMLKEKEAVAIGHFEKDYANISI
jgi:beta-aspartyl-dipeptidase (metallo-type)